MAQQTVTDIANGEQSIELTFEQFYTDDACCLKANPSRIGLVDRTFHDVNTHHPNARQHYPEGLERHKGITKRQYDDFLHSGIPPRGSLVICWAQLPGETFAKSTLILESVLSLVDRGLLLGDVVKRGPREAMTGTVIHRSVKCDLLPPQPWPTIRSNTTGSHRNMDNLSSDASQLLRGIPGVELSLAGSYHKGNTIICKDWIGRILETWEDVSIRLRNGSVVVPEDPEALEPILLDEPYQVGDFVTTKKANLRRGRWIYGAFDANVEPEGHVADVRTVSIEVRWLVQRYPLAGTTPSPEPPSFLDLDCLDSGEIFVYDRHTQPDETTGFNNEVSQKKESSPDFCIGDRVRFRDLAGATAKYDGNDSYGKLNRILKSDSLGFDINVFLVSRTWTETTILWQDLTTTVSSSVDLVPDMDLDDENVWPGEIITTRNNQSSDPSVFQPGRVGVVQTVNASERMAAVKWFPQGQLTLTSDMSIVLPGSYLGCSAEPLETVSLYDVRAVPGTLRKLGDIVLLLPMRNDHEEHRSLYAEVLSAVESPTDTKDWLGEVVGVGLDGLTTIRLGASTTRVRDIKIPLECTMVAVTLAEEEDVDDEDDIMSEGSSYGTDMTDSRSDKQGVWVDENDEVVEEDGVMDESKEWSTDSDEDNDVDMFDADVNGSSFQKVSHPPKHSSKPELRKTSNLDGASELSASGTAQLLQNAALDVTEPLQTAPTASWSFRRPVAAPIATTKAADIELDAVTMKPFAYASMFHEAGTDNDSGFAVPEDFLVLDGASPADHHFSGRSANIDGPRLRRIQKEHNILRSSLPDGVYVRTWESSLDMMRVLILGPMGTPYEYATFVIDFHLDSSFPTEPPHAFFHSWTDGTGPVNPNLYEGKDDGKICLSLLGTWPGDERNETWSSKSTILQIIVSILGLVLVSEPYFNEAGYEVRAGLPEFEIPSAMYTERTFFKSRAFIAHALRFPITGFEKEMTALYLVRDNGCPQLLLRAICASIEVVWRSRKSPNPDEQSRLGEEGRRVSRGALSPLKQRVDELLCILGEHDTESAEWLRLQLNGSENTSMATHEGQLFEIVQQRTTRAA